MAITVPITLATTIAFNTDSSSIPCLGNTRGDRGTPQDFALPPAALPPASIPPAEPLRADRSRNPPENLNTPILNAVILNATKYQHTEINNTKYRHTLRLSADNSSSPA